MDFNTLKTALKYLGIMLLVIVGFYATLMIGGLLIGVVSQTATSGSINVSTTMNTALTGYEGDYITQTTALSNNVPLVIGLVAIVVIVAVFFGKKFNFGAGGNSGSGLN